MVASYLTPGNTARRKCQRADKAGSLRESDGRPMALSVDLNPPRDNGPVPLQNRVTPLGEVIATPERGLVYGNRGCLHDDEGVHRRQYATRRWIACRLSFKGRRRPRLRAPGRYTELFFL